PALDSGPFEHEPARQFSAGLPHRVPGDIGMSEDPELVVPVDDDDTEIRSGLDRAIAGSTKVLAWAIFAAFAVTVFEVLSRYIFDSPTFWAHETTTFLI